MNNPDNLPAGPARDAAFYSAARKGDLEYADVRSSSDAEWAANGLRDGLSYGNLKGHERWANDFLANLDADFS
jgi:hypothetical protein